MNPVCCFCMKPYPVEEGQICAVCGDICCESCISDMQECPDCYDGQEEADSE